MTMPAQPMRLVIVPYGDPCPFNDVEPGLFIYDRRLFFMSEYSTHGKRDAYCMSGEAFWGPPPQTAESRAELIVQPMDAVWERAT